MHLPDGGGGQRAGVEAAKQRPEIGAIGILQHLFQLPGRHHMRLGPEAGEDQLQLRRQQVARLHRQQLPQLHRRAAHLRQLVGQAGDVAGRHHQIGQARALAPHQRLRTSQRHAAGKTWPDRPSGAPAKSGRWEPGGTGIGAVGHGWVHNRLEACEVGRRRAASMPRPNTPPSLPLPHRPTRAPSGRPRPLAPPPIRVARLGHGGHSGRAPARLAA